MTATDLHGSAAWPPAAQDQGTPLSAPHIKQQRFSEVRILMYSHDTFGLGHLRRCRAIAHALVGRFKGIHVLIISGSQIAGAFDFKARVDFVKIPSVIKLYNGEYTSIGRHIDIQETLEWRKEIIRSTAASFDPDMFIVDKEPLGLKGELLPTLEMLKARNCWLVAGLRDVMDEAEALSQEWARRDTLSLMDRFYDDVFIYGPEQFWNPLADIELPQGFEQRLIYTGFLRREQPVANLSSIESLPQDFVLVTAGGGGDGAPLMRASLAGHEADSAQTPLLLVLGPFMRTDDREEIRRIAARLPKVQVIDFHPQTELLLQRASAVVSMAGYNTFCEVLSLDKSALLVPRTQPRKEQLIRARRAAELGLVDTLMPEEAALPDVMARHLRNLPSRPRPMAAGADKMLGGLEQICDVVRTRFETMHRREVFLPPAAE
ncbi:MAG: glycosyltransferase family protein [Bosea sp. (in: a-proteobacteria)]